MLTNKTRFGLAMAVSPLALMAATPALAQSNTTQGPQAPADTQTAGATTAGNTNDDQAIVVTGFRAALRTATAKKKNSETVVESVSAEDIGKLPDNGIGESIARLPGISAQRSDGRANIISIRGFGPDFSTTTLNGRQQTTTNDSRAVEFDQYPSEVLAGVDVYKTAEADHTAGGLVGSIDLRTVRPLDAGKRIFAVGARGAYVDQKLQPKTSDLGGRVFATYVDQFAHDRVGISLSAAYTNEPYQTKDFNAWGYSGYPNGGQGMSGIKTYVESDQLKRFGANATVQERVTDNLTFTVDGFYSKFIDRITQRGFEMPLLFGAGHDAVLSSTSTNGLVTAATVTGTPVIENYANDRVANQYSVGWNALWDNHAGWRAVGDVSWSRTDRADDSLQTTAGLGRALPNPTATISYTMTPSGPQFVSNYNAANPALVLTDVEGWSSSPVQAGYDNRRMTSDDLVEARGEIEREVGSFIKSIKVGADFVTHTKKLTAQEAFLSPPNGADSAAIPADLLLNPTVLDRGLGPIISYDPRVLVANGVLTYIPNSYGATKGYNVRENVLTPYAMANLDSDLGSAHLTGNIGVQGVYTNLRSAGAEFPTVHDHYWMFLPSLNLNFRFDSGLVIRFAASKEYQRARLPDLNNIITNGGPNTTYNPVIYTGSGGNPYLRPYQAKALDLNFEKYFGTKGYVALQTFYKHIDTYISSGYVSGFDFTNYPPSSASTVPVSSPYGILFTSANTHGGHMYGAELAGTLPFDVFSSSLSGFGLTGGAGYTKSKIVNFDGSMSQIPGYSKYVGSLTAFYEAHGFSARGSVRYRSSYLGDFSLYSGGLTRQQVLAETIYDAQVGYDFPVGSRFAGVSVFVSGQNLTNERSATLAQNGSTPIPGAYLLYQTYGRRYLAGFTIKF